MKDMICYETTAILPKLTVTLYTSRKKLIRDLMDRGINHRVDDGVAAQTFTITHDGEDIHVVLMELDDCRENDKMGMLAHESVHIAMGYLRSLGEDVPAEEELAYVTQAAMQMLADMYFAKRDKKRKKQS